VKAKVLKDMDVGETLFDVVLKRLRFCGVRQAQETLEILGSYATFAEFHKDFDGARAAKSLGEQLEAFAEADAKRKGPE
jgi:hypothetical protein